MGIEASRSRKTETQPESQTPAQSVVTLPTAGANASPSNDASGTAEAGGRMTGAEMVIRALADQGVEHLFGYPGGAVLPIYDALFHQDKVRHVLVRHEQGAVHAAEGYARSTGKVGCVLVTSGPGAT